MNDWDDMNNEINQVQRLDETQQLDSSNIQGVRNLAGRGFNTGLAGPSDNLFLDQDKDLQESVVMSFNERAGASAMISHKIDINHAGLQTLSRVASVDITDFDWKYEK